MTSTEKTISGLIAGQLPDFVNAKYAENAPSFRRFIELYYKWMETVNASDGAQPVLSPDAFIAKFGSQYTVSSVPDVIGPYDPGDDSYWTLALPWSVNFNGSSHSTIYIESNSFVAFGTPNGVDPEFDPFQPFGCLTSSLALGTRDCWANRIHYGTAGTAPNRTFLVRFEGYNEYELGAGQGPENLIWEMTLYENNTSKIDFSFYPSNATDYFEDQNFGVLDVVASPSFPFILDFKTFPNFGFGRAYSLTTSAGAATLTEVAQYALGGNTVYEIMNSDKFRDIDETEDKFLTYFKSELLPYFPEKTELELVKILKGAKEFYLKKGTADSIKWLFRVLFNKESQIFYPRDNILRASDGKWQTPRSLKIALNGAVDLVTLIHRRVTGESSSSRAVIERAFHRIDEYTGFEYVEVFISNLEGEFINSEYVNVYDGETLLLRETIFGYVGNIIIDPQNRGLSYEIGDPAVIYGGYDSGSSVDLIRATASVSQVSNGEIISLHVNKRGYGYGIGNDSNTSNSNTIITVSNTGVDLTGSGAVFNVASVDLANSITLSLSTDTIYPYRNVVLNQSPHFIPAFPANPDSNINSTLTSCFQFKNILFSPILTVDIANAGSSYTVKPIVDFTTYYIVDGSTQKEISELGYIAAIEVVNGGQGYSNGDSVIFTGSGAGAVANVTVGAMGTITAVNLIQRGYGYTTMPSLTVDSVGNSANLKAFGFNDGAELDLTVDTFGKILDISLDQLGFGYTSRPNVSLKVMDIYVSNVAALSTAIDENVELVVYQNDGTTFSGNVDTYFTANDAKITRSPPNNTIRVYNFRGSLDPSTNILQLSTGDTLSMNTYTSYIAYGDQTAKACTVFIDGTVTHQGYFLNTDGFVSADKKLQDDYKYHNFSYVIESDKQLVDYKNSLLNIVHPAGMKVISHTTLSDAFSSNTTESREGHMKYVEDTVLTVNTGPIFFANTYYFRGYDIIDPFSGATQYLSVDPFRPQGFEQDPDANISYELLDALRYQVINLSNFTLDTSNTYELLAGAGSDLSSIVTGDTIQIEYANSNRKLVKTANSNGDIESVYIKEPLFIFGHGLATANGSKYITVTENIAGRILANDGIRIFDNARDATPKYRAVVEDNLVLQKGAITLAVSSGMVFTTSEGNNRVRILTTETGSADYMEGIVTAYDSGTGVMSVDILFLNGTSGNTHDSTPWVVESMENFIGYAGIVINNPTNNIIELDRVVPISNSNLGYIIDPTFVNASIKVIREI